MDVEEIRADHATDWEAMGQVAQLLGVSPTEPAPKWVPQAQADQADQADRPPKAPGQTSRARSRPR